MTTETQTSAWLRLGLAAFLFAAGGCGSTEARTKCPSGRGCQLPGDAGNSPSDASSPTSDARVSDGSRPGPNDAAPEPTVDAAPEAPIEGGPGCGAGSLCLAVRTAYAEAVQEAKSCSAGDHESCGQQAATGLGCDGCLVWVTSTTRLDALSAQFEAGECDTCFFGSPTGDRCHPLACRDLGVPMCTESGTCVSDLSCPPEAVNGEPCVPTALNYCEEEGGSKYCLCLQDSWQCNF
jgi:hypothetical protein